MANIAKAPDMGGDFSEFNVDFYHGLRPETTGKPYDRDNFPAWVFPRTIREMLAEAKEINQWPEAFGANGVLATICASLGSRLVVKDSDIFGNKAHPNVLFFINVGASINGKSPSRERFSDEMAVDLQKAKGDKHLEAVKIWRQYQAHTKRPLKTEEAKAKAKQLKSEYAAICGGMDIPPEEPFFYPYDIDAGFSTIEKVNDILNRRRELLNDPQTAGGALHGVMFSSSEIKSMIVAQKRYESNTIRALIAYWDKGRLSAATKTGGQISAENVGLVLIGDIQPGTAAGSFYSTENTENGFVQRVFSALRYTKTPYPKPQRPLPNEAKNAAIWRQIVTIINSDAIEPHLKTMSPENPERPYKGRTIPVSAKGREVYWKYAHMVAIKMYEISEAYPDDWRASSIGKTRTAVLRLALILQVLDYAHRYATAPNLQEKTAEIWHKEIQPEFIENAVALIDYYLNVNNALANPEKTIEEILGKKIHRDWFNDLPDEFSIPAEPAPVGIGRSIQFEIIGQLKKAGKVKKVGKSKYIKQ